MTEFSQDQKRIKELERENRRLKEALAELALCARKLRHTEQCRSESVRSKDIERISTAISVANLLT